MWLTILSDQLIVVALVSHYLTNKLIIREPLPAPPQIALARSFHLKMPPMDPPPYYKTFRSIIRNVGTGCSRVTHPFAAPSKGCPSASRDLHA